jgi:iron complex outermembrane recepter protein
VAGGTPIAPAGAVARADRSDVLGAVALCAAAFLTARAGGAQTSGESTPPDEPPIQRDTVEVTAPMPVDGSPVDASRFPGNVQSLSAERIDTLRRPDLAAALDETVAGVHLSDPQGNAFAANVYFRGFEASPQLGAPQGLSVYQDGVRMNDAFGDTVHWELLPTRALRQVEVVPGADPLFGRNSLGGAVALRTRTGFDGDLDSAEGSGGSFGRRGAAVERGRHEGAFGYFLSADGVQEDGWRDSSPSRVGRIFASGGWRGGRAGVDLSVSAAASDVAGNGTAPENLVDADRAAVFTRPDAANGRDVLVSARTRMDPSGSTGVVAEAHVRRTALETANGDLDPVQGSNDAAAVDRRTRTEATSGGGSARIESRARWLGLSQQLSAGAGFESGKSRYAAESELGAFDASRTFHGSGNFDRAAAVDLDASVANPYAFVTEAVSPWPAWTVTAAARWDAVRTELSDRIGSALDGSRRASRVNPSLGVTWAALPSLTAFARGGEASREPTPAELACSDPSAPCRIPTEFTSDPPLEEVVARTVEAGVRGRAGAVRWSAAAYRTSTSDDILFVASGGAPGRGYFANVGSTLRTGVEVSADASSGPWSGHLSYSWLRAEFGSGFLENVPDHPLARDGLLAVREGDRLPNLPEHSLEADVDFRASGAWTVGLGVRYLSSQFLRGDEANLLRPLGAQCAVSLRTTVRVGRGWEVWLRADNLLDARDDVYGELGTAEPLLPNPPGNRFVSPAAPRRFVAGLRFEH